MSDLHLFTRQTQHMASLSVWALTCGSCLPDPSIPLLVGVDGLHARHSSHIIKAQHRSMYILRVQTVFTLVLPWQRLLDALCMYKRNYCREGYKSHEIHQVTGNEKGRGRAGPHRDHSEVSSGSLHDQGPGTTRHHIFIHADMRTWHRHSLIDCSFLLHQIHQQ